MSKIIISCITPTFNREKLLARAINSTLEQTYPHWEMIIVNDGSKDNTEEVVNEFIKKDSRIKYFMNPGKGGNAARNYGIKQAKGEWIAFLDDDDENLPHRFESQLIALMKTNKSFLLSGFQIIDDKGKTRCKNTFLLRGNGAGFTSRWMIKKSLLIEAGLFDEEMPSMQEAEFSYRIALIETFVFQTDIVVSRRQTKGSISQGYNGLKGKIMLIQKHKNNMHPIEAAWWYYVGGMDYYRLGDKKNALLYIKKAAEKDTRLIYPFACFLFNMFYKLKFLKKINQKFLSLLEAFKFPVLVEHPIIK